jgi:hypothetical protein
VIYAPVPVSSYSTLLPQLVHNLTSTPSQSAEACHLSASTQGPIVHSTYSALSSPLPQPTTGVACQTDKSPRTCNKVQQVTFPTPCELLAELAERDCASAIRARQRSGLPSSSSSSSSSVSLSIVTGGGDARPVTKARQSRTIGKVRSSSSVISSPVATLKSLPSAPKLEAVLDRSKRPRPENIRKVYFRSVAEYVGFSPTDP